MTRYVAALVAFLLLNSILLPAADYKDICRDWLFSLSDDSCASEPGFADSSWRNLTLPHDWAFELGYSRTGAQKSQGGYMGGGVAWYRKHLPFTEEELAGKEFSIFFEGVYMNSEVWVNGNYLGLRPYGYISFRYDIGRYLHPGDNVISVRVDNSKEPSARWYHGCGIYGKVFLVSADPAHFVPDGIFVHTEISDAGRASVYVESEISDAAKGMSVEYSVMGPDGKKVASGKGIDAEMRIDSPELWSVSSPLLYTLEATIRDGKRLCDKERIRFGIREVEWKADSGFWLNGENIKIRGMAEHLEGGPVGAAWTRELLEWKLNMFKEMGCNAVRSTVKPHVPGFYDICDSLGILVLDELFDGWSRKAEHDYGAQAFDEWWRRDLRDFVRRDRNHPCVIAYGVGNETKGEIGKELVEYCHTLDPTRLVTSGQAEPRYMDIRGMNGPSEKKSFLTTYKGGDKPFLGTETPHTWQVRGFYRTQTWYRDGYPNPAQSPFETPDLTEKEIFGYDWISPEGRANAKQVFNSSYDNAYVRINARQNLEFLRDKPWYSGGFRWTGFDYLGESGYVHGGWPFRAFMSGVIDMAGFPKDHFYLYQSQWRDDLDMVHVLPHWTHPRMEKGTLIPVWAYTTGDSAELFLNGRSLGIMERGPEWNRMQCEWLVPWEEGTVEVRAYRDGRQIASETIRTAGAPARLEVTSNTQDMKPDGSDYAIVTIEQQDEKGEFYPYGENRIYFHTEGDIIVKSAENGSPVDVETNYDASSKKTFFGLLRLFIQSGYKDDDKSVFIGAVCGDKSLYSSDRITICTDEIVLDGTAPERDIDIRYTVDGTEPGKISEKYRRPFRLDGPATVKAAVYDGDKLLFVMEERFGENEGLYWGTPGEAVCTNVGENAEDGILKDAEVVEASDGNKCVRLQPYLGSVSCYQENDGPSRLVKVWFIYRLPQQAEQGKVVIYNNGKAVSEVLELESDSSWNTRNLDVRVAGGANSIEIRNAGDSAVLIDKIIVMEQMLED